MRHHPRIQQRLISGMTGCEHLLCDPCYEDIMNPVAEIGKTHGFCKPCRQTFFYGNLLFACTCCSLALYAMQKKKKKKKSKERRKQNQSRQAVMGFEFSTLWGSEKFVAAGVREDDADDEDYFASQDGPGDDDGFDEAEDDEEDDGMDAEGGQEGDGDDDDPGIWVGYIAPETEIDGNDKQVQPIEKYCIVICRMSSNKGITSKESKDGRNRVQINHKGMKRRRRLEGCIIRERLCNNAPTPSRFAFILATNSYQITL
ncbi:hypothetical protein BU25DRAFT_92791 [Macroventuria anomochaeta]|uniref:Uncharacterized protein n=1 Tax=Macroventuria anomochaeta TaxID=301207 RepID=A0ACB6RY35_9PLEO|nr:uncharacterized protein BU25DRAFT_92791 [Macroventuria anomochaeta]KAF2626689.1 hypothetical protein BU25DRAFT_92791 [Macroventuria anomochaeta]